MAAYFLRALMAVSLVLLLGCAHTVVSTPSPDPLVDRLSALQGKPLPLSVAVAESIHDVVGHQFLFVAIPFGRISVDRLGAVVTEALVQEAALRGFRPRIVTPGTDSAALEITVQSVEISAYDLLFVRRIVSRVCLAGVIKLVGQPYLIEACGDDSAFRALAFDQELGAVFHSSLALAVRDLIGQLHFGRSGLLVGSSLIMKPRRATGGAILKEQ